MMIFGGPNPTFLVKGCLLVGGRSVYIFHDYVSDNFVSFCFQELDLHDISSFDAELGKTLEELNALVCRKQFLESTYHESSGAIADLRFHGARIEELCFDFTLPGYPDYILKTGDETVCD